jgi:hypothetical protein
MRPKVMSKIVVVVTNVARDQRTAILTRLRAITGQGLGKINRCLTSGEPILQVALFRNDHEEVAARLREMLSAIPTVGARLRLFEIAPYEEPGPQMFQHEISREILKNILDGWEKYDHSIE